ncbi:hypothetical protein [Sinomonas sp. ASV322]|uniref:hypothetical protein n=1 Tax=Sinomonas sp. ASV322 TaxID=3041920 RepID=UPI0027DCC3D1|nr:hypothetical protein [Sinomonas sp. ASV322]MDQ4503049.1 hypothetical protein [Sinomonas sp. ASV322]
MNSRPSPEDRLVVERLLADVAPAESAELRPLLEGLRALAHPGPVEPRADVARLLVGEAAPAPVSLDVYRRSAASTAARHGSPAGRGRRRTLAAAVALTAALGAGTAAAAAADPGFRGALGDGVSTVVRVLTGHAGPSPSNPAPKAPAVPAQPAPSSTGTPGPRPSSTTSSSAHPASATPAPTSPQDRQPPRPSLGVPSLPIPGASELPRPDLGWGQQLPLP